MTQTSCASFQAPQKLRCVHGVCMFCRVSPKQQNNDLEEKEKMRCHDVVIFVEQQQSLSPVGLALHCCLLTCFFSLSCSAFFGCVPHRHHDSTVVDRSHCAIPHHLGLNGLPQHLPMLVGTDGQLEVVAVLASQSTTTTTTMCRSKRDGLHFWAWRRHC